MPKQISKEDAERLYQQSMAPDAFATSSIEEKLERLGQLTDIAGDLARPEGLDRALAVSSELEKEDLTAAQQGTLHYFCANVWSHRRTLGGDRRARWEMPELEQEILELRRAIRYADALSAERTSEIFTNLGNALSRCGRFIDALAAWDRALALDAEFGMAVGNRAIELSYYSRLLWRPHDQIVLLQESYAEFQRTLTLSLPEYAKRVFIEGKARIEQTVKPVVFQGRHDLKTGDLGASEEEQSYRRWCLANRLFLNPVNDLGPYPAGASDPLALPGMRVPMTEGPRHVGFFNTMKQEFASARYMAFAGTHASTVHFSDLGVRLVNTLDYPSYSYGTEQLKAAYRITYSLFDKIAFFLNDYLALGIPEKQVYFRTLWYKDYRQKHLHKSVRLLPHSPLQALFWLSKDLYEEASGLPASLEPEARELAETRQHLEHKYLKVHLPDWHGPPSPEDAGARSPADTLAYSVRYKDFAEKTVRLLQLARSALLYLACTVHQDEIRRAKASPNTRTMPIELSEFEDDWKR